MIYIKVGAYLIPIIFMTSCLPCKTKYSDDYHLSVKGFCAATLIYYLINKFCIWATDGSFKFNYMPCMVLSLFRVLYLEWKNFNRKWIGADKLYHGRFATIQSLINAGTSYTAEYANFYIIEPREDRRGYDKKIQIALPFHEYIRYYIFLIQKQKQDYKKKEAEADIAAANSIKKILSEYVVKNEDEANKYIAQSKEILQQIKSGQVLKPLDITSLGAEETDWHYAVVEIYNPDSTNSKNKYKFFPDYDSAVSHLKHRMEDEKINLYLQRSKASEIHITDNIWDLTAHGTWGKITMYRWAILKVKK